MRASVVKWYMDVVGDHGDTFVGCYAEVRWKGLKFAYASALVDTALGRRDQHRVAWRARGAPMILGADLEWSAPGLAVSGVWRGLDRSEERVLLDEPALSVRWCCRASEARASVRLPEGRLEGCGYVETLGLWGDVRQLPIDVLRWGRWAADQSAPGADADGSAARSLVWICWEGSRPLTLVLVDGRQVTKASIDETAITTEGFTLAIEQVRTLREGRLGGTVGRALPGACRPLLAGIAAWRETKWLARGTLAGAAGGRPGWVIHEQVTM